MLNNIPIKAITIGTTTTLLFKQMNIIETKPQLFFSGIGLIFLANMIFEDNKENRIMAPISDINKIQQIK